MAYSMGIALV